LSTFYKSNPFPSNVGIKINQGSGSLGGTFYMAAKKGNIYITVSGKRYSDNETVILLDIIESKEMEDGLITINADYMATKLKEAGHVALQGILFDLNKATLKEESKPLLAEIAKMLNANPTFRLYIVGHTDMTGELKYNLELSSQRASTVVNYLVEQHKIALTRFSAQGIGPLAPIASNESEESKSKNRRVELVLTDHTFSPR
jgi:outer membrane protein OmpA-like peptidoglycan-associated protein